MPSLLSRMKSDAPLIILDEIFSMELECCKDIRKKNKALNLVCFILTFSLKSKGEYKWEIK